MVTPNVFELCWGLIDCQLISMDKWADGQLTSVGATQSSAFLTIWAEASRWSCFSFPSPWCTSLNTVVFKEDEPALIERMMLAMTKRGYECYFPSIWVFEVRAGFMSDLRCVK